MGAGGPGFATILLPPRENYFTWAWFLSSKGNFLLKFCKIWKSWLSMGLGL